MERGEARERLVGADAAAENPATGPVPWLSLRLHPESRIPLHRQLAAQIGAAVRGGRWDPEHRLPSARALAGRLGVDRGTVLAAYRDLAGDGLVRVRPGSGAYVSGPEPGAGSGAATDAFRAFVARERERGSGTAELAELFSRWRASLGAGRVIVAEDEPGLAALWRAELQALLPAVRIEGALPSELRRWPGRAEGSVVAASARHVSGLRAALPPWVEVVPLRPPGGSPERRFLLRMAVGAVILLVSVSPVLRRRFREVAAGLRGREVAAVALPPAPTPRLERTLRVARFVLADVACRPRLGGRVDPRRLLCLRTLDPAVAAELAERMALAAPAGARGRVVAPGTSRRRRVRA
ncbi:MAG TPA: GntR family transcriptional regulator [Gemmatimonadota bacterium]|nr:GntR family transcriptional regulator [Gemmatimonadota bacterium]